MGSSWTVSRSCLHHWRPFTRGWLRRLSPCAQHSTPRLSQTAGHSYTNQPQPRALKRLPQRPAHAAALARGHVPGAGSAGSCRPRRDDHAGFSAASPRSCPARVYDFHTEDKCPFPGLLQGNPACFDSPFEFGSDHNRIKSVTEPQTEENRHFTFTSGRTGCSSNLKTVRRQFGNRRFPKQPISREAVGLRHQQTQV